MDVEQAHEYCSEHRNLVLKSNKIGCFYCLRTYSPSKISEWIDAGQTALCASCGVDAVVPGFWGLTNLGFLKVMYDKWFYFDRNNHIYYKMDNGNVAAIIEVKNGVELKKWEWIEED